MYDQFEETKEFEAVLIVNEWEQEPCGVRLRYNPYDLNSMEAEIFDPPELSIPDLPEDPSFADYEELDAKLVSESEDLTRIVTLRSDALSSLSFSGAVSALSDTIPVQKYRVAQWWEPKTKCANLGVTYQFPLTTAVRDRSTTTRDARHGFYHGRRNQTESIVELERDSFIIDTPTGEAEFVESYGTHKLDSKRTHPAVTLISRSECYFELNCDAVEHQQEIRKARQEVDTLLHLLSLAEQNRINWSKESAFMQSENGDPVGQIKTYRWTPPTSDKYRPDPSSLRKVRRSFKEICDAYYDLNPSIRTDLDQAIENFKRTNCTGTLETKLVFWYSCLDHLTKIYSFGRSRGSLSKRLVLSCKENDIEIGDLLDARVVRHFQERLDDEHNCFWFVDARNRFVHEGLDALHDESYQLIEAIRNARALAERLLLHKLGLDHNELCNRDQFCLGSPSVRQ